MATKRFYTALRWIELDNGPDGWAGPVGDRMILFSKLGGHWRAFSGPRLDQKVSLDLSAVPDAIKDTGVGSKRREVRASDLETAVKAVAKAIQAGAEVVLAANADPDMLALREAQELKRRVTAAEAADPVTFPAAGGKTGRGASYEILIHDNMAGTLSFEGGWGRTSWVARDAAGVPVRLCLDPANRDQAFTAVREAVGRGAFPTDDAVIAQRRQEAHAEVRRVTELRRLAHEANSVGALAFASELRSIVEWFDREKPNMSPDLDRARSLLEKVKWAPSTDTEVNSPSP